MNKTISIFSSFVLLALLAPPAHADTTTYIANINNFGADGTDQTDDSVNIQKAIDDVAAHGGGTVYIPEGTYYLGQIKGINSALLLLKSNLVFKGDGANSILKVANNLNQIGKEFNVFAPYDNTNNNRVDNVQFYNFKIDENGANNPVPQQEPNKPNRAIMVRFGSNITVDHMIFENNAGQQTISLGNNTNPQNSTVSTMKMIMKKSL